MIEYIALAGFAIPGMAVLFIVATAKPKPCPECDGMMQMIFNGDYRCDDCFYHEDD